MKKYTKLVLFGFIIWLIPFVVSILIFPLKSSTPALFESIMPVVITICVIVLSILYFKKVTTNFLKEGILIGVIWFAISIVVDSVMFSRGPMKMPIMDYFMDIGLSYLIIRTISIGLGYILDRKNE